MNAHYPAVARRAGHRCEYCRAPEAIFNFPFEVEHIIPTARSGPETDANLALACRACNLRKSDHVSGWDDVSAAEVPLFHPRRDRWEDLFEADATTGTINGRTPAGRATVARLQMNGTVQQDARRLWARLGLYP